MPLVQIIYILHVCVVLGIMYIPKEYIYECSPSLSHILGLVRKQVLFLEQKGRKRWWWWWWWRWWCTTWKKRSINKRKFRRDTKDTTTVSMDEGLPRNIDFKQDERGEIQGSEWSTVTTVINIKNGIPTPKRRKGTETETEKASPLWKRKITGGGGGGFLLASLFSLLFTFTPLYFYF